MEIKFRMTVVDAAKYYDKDERTIYRWIHEGKLVARKDPGGRDWWILGERDTSLVIINPTSH